MIWSLIAGLGLIAVLWVGGGRAAWKERARRVRRKAEFDACMGRLDAAIWALHAKQRAEVSRSTATDAPEAQSNED